MNKLKNIFKSIKTKVAVTASMVSVATVNAALAAPDMSSVTKPFDNLISVITTVVGSIGVVLLLWAIVNIAIALSNDNASDIARHLKLLAAGALLAGIGIVIAIIRS